MSDHVLLNLFNELGKFHNKFTNSIIQCYQNYFEIFFLA